MLYIITAVHNRFAITKRFTETLLRQTTQDYRLILVDDGSTDGTADMVRQALPQSIILRGDGSLWWGGALHMAYRYIKNNADILDTDMVLMANDDSIIPDSFLETGVRILAQNPDTLVTGCGYGLHCKKQLDGAVHYDFANSQDTVLMGEVEGNCASTRELFLSVRTLRALGGFHPHLLPHYLSDYEYTIRASKRGYKIKAYEALRYDYDEGTTGTNSDKKLTVKQLFSKRCMANPLHRINFIFMVTPFRHLPKALLCQFRRYGKKLKA